MCCVSFSYYRRCSYINTFVKSDTLGLSLQHTETAPHCPVMRSASQLPTPPCLDFFWWRQICLEVVIAVVQYTTYAALLILSLWKNIHVWRCSLVSVLLWFLLMLYCEAIYYGRHSSWWEMTFLISCCTQLLSIAVPAATKYTVPSCVCLQLIPTLNSWIYHVR